MESATGLLHPATMDTSPVYTSPTPREDYLIITDLKPVEEKEKKFEKGEG